MFRLRCLDLNPMVDPEDNIGEYDYEDCLYNQASRLESESTGA